MTTPARVSIRRYTLAPQVVILVTLQRGPLLVSPQSRATGGKKEGRRLLEGYAPLRSPAPGRGECYICILQSVQRGVVARSLGTAWRPTIRRKRIGLLTSSFALAHSNPWAPGSSIVLVLKVSGKPRRDTGHARGTPFGTMSRNRAAQPCVRRFSRHKQPPGPLNPLFSSVLRTGYIQAEGEGFEPSRANAHPPPRPPPKGAGA